MPHLRNFTLFAIAKADRLYGLKEMRKKHSKKKKYYYNDTLFSVHNFFFTASLACSSMGILFLIWFWKDDFSSTERLVLFNKLSALNENAIKDELQISPSGNSLDAEHYYHRSTIITRLVVSILLQLISLIDV